MAKKTDDKPQSVKAFVLADCLFGSAGMVVELTPADAEAGERAGMLDLHPEAIAAASPNAGQTEGK